MGIGITSNWGMVARRRRTESVSIPNGDRHYLELPSGCVLICIVVFQSPMGIGITSNPVMLFVMPEIEGVFQSPMGIGITSNLLPLLRPAPFVAGFNPQWG